MAITLSTIYNLDTLKFNFTDTSTYSVSAKGCLRITSPAGVIIYEHVNYANPALATTPDFTDINTTNNSINLPLDANSKVQRGFYKIEYNVYTSSIENLTLEIDYCFVTPTLNIEFDLDCVEAVLTSKDSTNYVKSGVSPSMSRTHTFQYPSDLTKGNISNSTASISINSPWSGGYTTTVSNVLTYIFPSYSVISTLSGNKSYTAECDKGICGVMCGVQGLEMVYSDYLDKGAASQAETLRQKLIMIGFYITLTREALRCKRNADANRYLSKIKEIGGFDDLCCGGEDEPYQIIPQI